MDAMILAAGAGVRLRPLTDRVPKALIRVRDRPLLAHVLDRLTAAGATRVIVNTHHHADQIAAYLTDHTPAGVEVVLSPEPDGPYDTGGGLLAAAPLFRRDGPILVHNVDVLSAVPLADLLQGHAAARATAGDRLVASVAVQARNARRRLLFDGAGLVGWENRNADGTVGGARRARDPVGDVTPWSFTGIHVVEPGMFDLVWRRGTFSIVSWYLDLVERGYVVHPFDVSAHAWMDVGTPERLADAEGHGPW